MKAIMRFLTLCMASAAAIVLVAACGSPVEGSTSNSNNSNVSGQVATLVVTPLQPADIEPLPTGDAGVSVVARVNGEAITLEDYQRELEHSERQQINVQNVTAFQEMVLDIMVEQTLINQQAAQNNINVSDDEINAELQSNIALAGSPEAWQQWLTANYYTEDEFRATLRDALLTARVRDFVIGDISGNVPHVHARHILVADEALANELIARISNGEDFAALAAQYSLDETSKNNGGDLGWFAEDELLQPALAYSAFSSNLQEIIGPVQSELGYHILQVLEREDRPVDDARRAALSQARFTNWLTSLLESASIERYLR